jgi:TRAP-type C4-dicarboxylate transport system substrate-binding protein
MNSISKQWLFGRTIMQKFTRRRFLTVATAVPLAGILTRPAGAAEFTLKFANGQDPTHPVNKRAAEAFERIKTATNGRVEINLFPSGQLGSDTDLLGQVRNGAIDYLNLSSSVLAILVPAAGIINTGFAFTSSDQVWTAMDGGLGAYVKRGIEKVGLPAAPILTSLFQALGAGPTPINFNELYSALQTKVVDGQENPLAVIATAKLNEVQKSRSIARSPATSGMPISFSAIDVRSSGCPPT